MSLTDRYRNLEDPLRTERRVELVLIVVALFLLLQLLWGIFQALFPSVPDPVQPRPNSLQVAQLETEAQIDSELRAEIAARPLFWSSRRPLESISKADAVAAAKAEQEESQKPGKIDGVKLTGVFGSGEAAGIIVLAKGKKRRVMVGEEVNGWKLVSVDLSEAVFSNSGRDARLALKQGTIQVSQVDSATSAEGSVEAKQSRKSSKAKRKAEPEPANDTLTLGGRAQAKKS